MRKPVGALLVAISVLFFVGAALSFVGNVFPAAIAVFQQPSAYVIGYLIGSLAVVVLFVYLGRKAMRAGRARFSGAVERGEPDAMHTATRQMPASGG